MAPERPRSAGFDVPLGPRIIERKPRSELHEFSRAPRIEIRQPKSILRRPAVEPAGAEYVELREPRRSHPSTLSPRRSPPDDFIPLTPHAPSPRPRSEDEPPVLDFSNRRRPLVVHHSPSPPPREHRRRQASPPPPNTVREVETIRIRRLDKNDKSKAESRRAREIEEEARNERELRHNAEATSRRLAEVAMRERTERRQAERVAQDAEVQRRSAEIAAADLQRQNEQLHRERRRAEREAAALEAGLDREQERARNAPGRPQDWFQPARETAPQPRTSPRTQPDRGAEVIQAAQEARRHRRRQSITYDAHGRRIDFGRWE